jgi:hypothetical protein
LTGDLAEVVRVAGGRLEAVDKYGPSYVEDLIQNRHGFALSLTTLLLFITYQLTLSGLVGSLTLLAVKVAGTQQPTPEGQTPASRVPAPGD